MKRTLSLTLCFAVCLSLSTQGAGLNLFQGSSDVGNPSQKGSASYNPPSATYSLSGGGENIWFTNDAFHFVWTKLSGDFTLSAALKWATTDGHAQKKAASWCARTCPPIRPIST